MPRRRLVGREGQIPDAAGQAGRSRTDHGNGVAIFRQEAATVVCAADTVLGGTEIPAYGEVVRVGSLCDSESSGVRCTNEDSGHGFTL